MQEAFLHYIWLTRQFDPRQLRLTDGRPLEIIGYGKHNHDSGPDFQHGQIRIEDTMLAGHIEIHIQSAEWRQHGHHEDPAYKNVILHVVWSDDQPVIGTHRQPIPTLELETRVSQSMYRHYLRIMHNQERIPCRPLHPEQVPAEIWAIWKERLVIERLQRKVHLVSTHADLAVQDWEEILFRQLCIAMGMKVNKAAMEHLASKLSKLVLERNRDRSLAVPALIFGVAGMLSSDPCDEYQRSLKQEWEFQKNKYQLQEMNSVEWKYARMHPPNFPDIRLAQLVKLFSTHSHLLSTIVNDPEISSVRKLLAPGELDDYWLTHFRLGKEPSTSRTKKIGNQSIDILIINAVVPVLFLYAYTQGDNSLQDKAITMLERMAPEVNSVTRLWKSIGVDSAHAGDSQALIQLTNEYCSEKRCLECSIGHHLLRT